MLHREGTCYSGIHQTVCFVSPEQWTYSAIVTDRTRVSLPPLLVTYSYEAVLSDTISRTQKPTFAAKNARTVKNVIFATDPDLSVVRRGSYAM
jgi:hypothetical protein